MEARSMESRANSSQSAVNDELPNQLVPVYLEYPPAGWPDALPARRSLVLGRRLRFWLRGSLLATSVYM